jgi:type IV pilus assembly protein PilE
MKGFTLVELLVVLVILGLLSVLAYPSYAGYVRKSRRFEGQMALRNAMQQEVRYFSQHNSYMAFSATDPDPAPFHWWSGSTAPASAYELDAHACPDTAITECVELRARPGTERVDAHFRDPECGTLTLDSTDRQASTGTFDRCWP